MQVASVQMTVACPRCGMEQDVDIEALYGSGDVPRCNERCAACGTHFTVSATLDVSVEVKS